MRKCRDCRLCEPIGKGQRGGLGPEIDIGLCHDKPPVIGPQALPMVGLDFDWCDEMKVRRWWHLDT